jgi:ABC-type molybdate transport system substrate-binding protein
VDLAESSLAAFYDHAVVTVRGAAGGSRVTFRGQPIVYAFAVPRDAPHRALGERFANFRLSEVGRRILRREGLDALDTAVRVP